MRMISRRCFPIALSILIFVLLMSHNSSVPNNVSHAQTSDAACNDLVESALDSVANTCLNIGLNEVCYGNDHVSATLNDSSMFFEAPGDIVPVTALDAIITRPVDLEANEWGIALMNLEADLPDGNDSMRIVLFGDVEVTPTQVELIDDAPTCVYSNTANDSMNMRAGPGTSYQVVDILDQGDTLITTGQNTTGDWVRSARGWVYAPFGTLDCGENTLRTIEDAADVYTSPMQAFTLQVSEDAQCQSAPSGMLVQTASGQTANIMVNNIEMRIGSTAFIGLPPSSDEDADLEKLIVATIEGDVSLTLSTRTQSLIAGTQIIVQTNTDGHVSFAGARSPFDASSYNLEGLLSSTLPTAVAVPPPIGIDGTSSGGGGSGNQLSVPNVRCRVGQNPGSAAQYFSGDGATIVDERTTRSGGAATITFETLTSSRSISYIFSCNSVGVSTFTTTITDSNGRTLSDTFTVTVQ